MRGVLIPAAYAWRSRQLAQSESYSVTSVRWSEERPQIAQVDQRVVTRIKLGVRDLSQWRTQRDLVLERGLFVEAA